MRCEEVIQELAVPTVLDPASLADHLASCPRCAEWSRQAHQFDRVWKATRPAAPSSQAMDALWARASAAIDATPRLEVIPFARTSRRKSWVVALVAAQAAAVLIAASVWFTRGPVVAQVTPPLNVGVDQTVVVRIDDDGHQVEILDDSSQFSFSMADATPHDVFSAVESMVAK